MSSEKPRIDAIDPEDLLVLREVDPSLPDMVGDAWREAWDPLFRAAHQGTCWLAWVRERGAEKSNGGDRDSRKPGTPVGYIAAQRQFFGKWLITSIKVAAGFDRRDVAAGMLRFVEGRQRGETVLAATPEDDEELRSLLQEAGYEAVGELRLPDLSAGFRIMGKVVPERTRRPDRPEPPKEEAPPPADESVAVNPSPDETPVPAAPAVEPEKPAAE